VVDLSGSIARRMVIRMKAREEEDCRNALLKKRPLVAPAHQIFGSEIVSEVERQTDLIIHARNDRFQIRAEGSSEYVQRIRVFRRLLFRNLLRTIRWVFFITTDHVHLKHRDGSIQGKTSMADVVAAAEQ